MPLRITCEACGRAFKVDEKFAGRMGKCPNPECQQPFRVPFETDVEPVSPARPATPPPRAVKPVAGKSPSPKASERRSLQWGQAATAVKPALPRPKRRTLPLWVLGGGAVLLIGLGVLVWFGMKREAAGPSLAATAQAAEAAPVVSPLMAHGLPFAKKYCLDCHSGAEPEGSLTLADDRDDAAVLRNRKVWEHALNLIQQGVMPPADAPQPTAAERDAAIAALDHALYFVDCSKGIDPGRVTIRRLNRNEYNRTVRDLLGIDFRPADDFPSDDVGYGFDNIGDVLSLPPLLMEKYLDASEAIAQRAIVAIDPQSPPVKQTSPRQLQREGGAQETGDIVAIISAGNVSTEFEAPVGGRYRLVARAGAQQAGRDAAEMEFQLDKSAVKKFDVKARQNRLQDYEFEVQVKRGTHRFTAVFTNDYYDPRKKEDRNLYVQSLTVVGPLAIDAEDLPASQLLLVKHRPDASTSTNYAVRANLQPFLRRAFRRPVRDSELDPYVKLVEGVLADGQPFEFAMQQAVAAALVSPHFLFRVETDRNPDDPTDRHSLSDHELAVRLSYFLWSTMPDEELFKLADKGELNRTDTLTAQVQRMLLDPKASALVDNFAEQWLQLRILDEVTPDPAVFPEYKPELRDDLKQETKALFAHVMREDLPLREFLTARYTFVNERLAKHYGYPGVTGPEFRQVDVGATQRVGLLTHGSILTMTSNPNRTSPVKRGKWIMEVVLNTPPPPPPPNAPDLESTVVPPDASLRQQMVLHRANGTCASCHRTMDDLGFGLENFDPLGRWRDQDRGQPLDVTGELPGGLKFTGPSELAAVLVKKETEFVRCLTEKLLIYSLGRPVEYYDRCTQNQIVEAVRQHDGKFSALIRSIVLSEPFRMRRGEQPHTK